MTLHKMKLTPEPFNLIKNGQKVIESRLYDDKRALIAVGDTIEFTSVETAEKILTEVMDLLRYSNFEEMFRDNKPAEFGGSNVDELLNQIQRFYSREGQASRGVVGIRIRVIS